jgi:antitoxin HicB
VASKSPRTGSSFDSWLDEEGIREEVTAAAIKAVIARLLASEMKKKEDHQATDGATYENQPRAGRRLLDPDNGSATIESLQRVQDSRTRVAAAVGVGLSAPARTTM